MMIPSVNSRQSRKLFKLISSLKILLHYYYYINYIILISLLYNLIFLLCNKVIFSLVI